MAKEESGKSESKECPSCKFAGTDSDKSKFSEEQITQFPKGYAPENHPKTKMITNGGKQVQVFVTDQKHEIIFEKIKRCPVCGYVEGGKL